MKIGSHKGNRHFYGWTVAVGCMLIYFYGLGLTSNIISMFVEPIIPALDLSKTQGSTLMSVQYTFGILGLLAGGEYYKHGSTRLGALICGLMIALGYLLLGLAGNLWVCYVAMGLIGTGYGGGVFVPASMMLTRWFIHRRGIALSIAACGSGLSTILYPPVIEYLVRVHGFLSACIFQSSTILLLTIVAFAMVRNHPAEMGLCALGEDVDGEVVPKTDAEEDTISWLTLLRDKKVLLLLLCVLLAGMVVIPVNSHLKIFYSSSGYSSVLAAAMVSVHGAFMLVGKPVFGAIVDRVGTKRASTYIYGMVALADFCGLMMRRFSIFAYLFPVFMGLSSALSPMATPLWAADIHEGKYYSQIYTCTRIAFTLGGSISLVLPGTVADLTGYYTPVLGIYILILLVSYFVLLRMYKAERV